MKREHSTQASRQAESGNVFFYIFLGIALLAALSYAVANGGRATVQNLSDDRLNLVAAEVISYGDTVTKTVSQLRLRGTQLTELSFANAFLSTGEYGTYNNDPSNEVFNPSGGAVVYTDPPSDAVTAVVDWQFLANNEVELIGTTPNDASGSDLIMALPSVRQNVCIKINELLGVSNPAGAPPTDGDIDEDNKFEPGATPFGYDETVGDEDSALEGQREACFEETGDGEYVYYKVLIPR